MPSPASAASPNPVPDFTARQAMWAAVDFVPLSAQLPAVERFVAELRPLYASEQVLHATFKLPEHPVFDWFASRNRYHEIGFFERFWQSPGPATVFPEASPFPSVNFLDPKVFSWSSPFLLGGSLAWALSSGGAYHSFARGGHEAKKLGEEAASEMLGDNYDQPLVFESNIAWSGFFFGVAWDHTYLAIDYPRRVIHALLATDTVGSSRVDLQACKLEYSIVSPK